MIQHVPWFGNYAIMTLYATNMAYLAYFRMWPDVWYWASALSITACITFGFTR